MADSTDPLSLLAGDDTSSSESEGEEETKDKGLTDKSYYTPTATNAEKLPPPDSLFTAFSCPPSFLSNHIDPHHINWDRLVKNADPPVTQDDPETTPTNPKYSAIPPPKELETESEISALPVRYSQEDSAPLSDHEATSPIESKTGDKRSSSMKNPSSSKKPKVETFNEKEKRKRDLGMSSRGKSFVEEEKRLLRQQYDQ